MPSARRFTDLGQEIPPTEQQTPRWLDELQRREIETLVPLIKAAKVKID